MAAVGGKAEDKMATTAYFSHMVNILLLVVAKAIDFL